MSSDLQTEALRSLVNRRLARLEMVREDLRRRQKEWVDADNAAGDAEEAQKVVQVVAQVVQQRAHERIAGVVSRCLEAVFDEPYEFRINFEQKRGRTEASLAFVRDGISVDPLSASGGGVVDVAAFALRLSCLLLVRPPVRRLLVLDEPFKFVSEEYRDRVVAMMERLARDLKVQIVMVTHIDELKIGKVVEL